MPETTYRRERMNGPTFAHAILTTAELIAALPTVSRAEEKVQ
jgi:hypothetical protein